MIAIASWFSSTSSSRRWRRSAVTHRRQRCQRDNEGVHDNVIAISWWRRRQDDFDVVTAYNDTTTASASLSRCRCRRDIVVTISSFLKPPLKKIIWAPARLSQTKRCTKLHVSSSSSIEDMLDCMPKIEGSRDLGHAPFGENYWCAHAAFPSGSCVLNLKSLAQVVLKIGSIVCQKF